MWTPTASDVTGGNEPSSIKFESSPFDETASLQPRPPSIIKALGELGEYQALPVLPTGEDAISAHSVLDQWQGCMCSNSNATSMMCIAEAKAAEGNEDALEDCDCVAEHGNFYDPQVHHRLRKINLRAIPPDFLLYECGPACRCSLADPPRCSNRVVQDGIKARLQLRSTSPSENVKHKGFGLFSDEPIPEGTFVCLYSGEILTLEEAKTRWQNREVSLPAEEGEPQADGDGKGNYILVVRETSRPGGVGIEDISRSEDDDADETIGEQEVHELKTIIDPTRIGNASRFINHACPPSTNLIVLPIRPVGSLLPLAAMFSARDIEPDEELTFDYEDAGGEGWFFGRDVSAGENGEDKSQPKKKTRCLCGSARCRGYLPLDPNL